MYGSFGRGNSCYVYLVRFSLEDDVNTFPLFLNNKVELLILVIFCSD